MDNNLKPTFGGSFRHGWQTMMKYFLILLLIVIVIGIVMTPMSIGRDNDAEIKIQGIEHFEHWEHVNITWDAPVAASAGIFALLGFLAMAYNLLVVPVISYGADISFVEAARDKRPEFENLIKGFKNNYLYIVLAHLLTSALIMLGFFLLLIPGIIVACRLAFVSYLVMDKGLDPIKAVEESWRMTRGHGWKIFFMAIASFFVCILGLALLFVGIIPAIIWVKSSFASLYEAILRKNELEPAMVY